MSSSWETQPDLRTSESGGDFAEPPVVTSFSSCAGWTAESTMDQAGQQEQMRGASDESRLHQEPNSRGEDISNLDLLDVSAMGQDRHFLQQQQDILDKLQAQCGPSHQGRSTRRDPPVRRVTPPSSIHSLSHKRDSDTQSLQRQQGVSSPSESLSCSGNPTKKQELPKPPPLQVASFPLRNSCSEDSGIRQVHSSTSLKKAPTTLKHDYRDKDETENTSVWKSSHSAPTTPSYSKDLVDEQQRIWDAIQREKRQQQAEPQADQVVPPKSQFKVPVSRLAAETTKQQELYSSLPKQPGVRTTVEKNAGNEDLSLKKDASRSPHVRLQEEDHIRVLSDGQKVRVKGTRHVYNAVLQQQQQGAASSSSSSGLQFVSCPGCEGLLLVEDDGNDSKKPNLLYCPCCQQVSPLEVCRVLQDNVRMTGNLCSARPSLHDSRQAGSEFDKNSDPNIDQKEGSAGLK